MAAGLLGAAALSAGAQRKCNLKIGDPVYRKFAEAKDSDTTTATMLAREYLKVCNDTSLVMTRAVNAYLSEIDRPRVPDRVARRVELANLIYTEKKFPEAFALGAELVAQDSTDLEALINLGYAGFLALQTQDRQFDTLATRYGGRAIRMIEGGTNRTDWQPFASREETLAWLHFTLGALLYDTKPLESAHHLYATAALETSLKSEPTLYYQLAAALENALYQPLYKDYTSRFGGKQRTKESDAAKARIDSVMDRLIDVYAHAVAYEKPDSPDRANGLQRLTAYYKARNGGKDAGIDALIEKAKTTPLMPMQP